jgi:hypothetical protein
MVKQKYRNLQQIVAMAVTDDGFRASLLNGDRPDLIDQFSLDQDEQKAILVAKSVSFKSFAKELMDLIEGDEVAK